MAYNPMFPVNYMGGYPQMQYNPQPPQNLNNSNLIWVQGEAGAKSYLVAPNSTVQLWDSESQTIFLKSADASGMPSMKILDYKIRESAQPPQPQIVNDYVTKDELSAFRKEIQKQLESLKGVKRESAISDDEQ